MSVFYGYKGGSGRSFTLAHVASILVRGYGRRVLVVDADIEAPGVGDFFTRMPGFPNPNFARQWRSAPGLLEAIDAYRSVLDYDELRKRLRADAFFSPRYFQKVFVAEGGQLDLLGPGKIRGIDADYAGNVILQDWNDFYAYGGQLFFHSFARALLEEGLYDHVLFDMRAGFAASTAPAAVAIADDLVIFANPSHQSIVGLEELAAWLDRERQRLHEYIDIKELRRAAVLTRVEGNLAGGVAWDVFTEFFNSRYELLKLPHLADLQHEQIIGLNSDNRALVDELCRLAAWIAHDNDATKALTERAFPPQHDSRKPPKPSDVRDLGSVQKVKLLIEQARKLVDKPDEKTLPTAGAPAENGNAEAVDRSASSAERPQPSADDVRNQYNKLFLLEAALWDRLLKGLGAETADQIERALWDVRAPQADAEPAAGESVSTVVSSGTSDGADAGTAGEPPSFNHDTWFPAGFSSPADVVKLADAAGLRGAATEIADWLGREPNAPGDKRASAAQDLLRRAAFLEDADLFESARTELRHNAEDFDDLSPEQQWAVGYSLVFAADAMRQLGGCFFPEGQRLLRRGWQAGALFSPGKPPFAYEASGLLTYAFFFSMSGQVAAARKTLRNLYTAVKKHTRGNDLFKVISDNHEWWAAAFLLHGADGGNGVTDEIVEVDRTADRETLGPLNSVFLDGWLMVARRWRGEFAEASEAGARAVGQQRFYQWLGEPPRLLKLTMLLGQAQLEVAQENGASLAATLEEAEAWAADASPLTAATVRAHRLHIELMYGLSDDRRAHRAVGAAIAVALDDLPRASPLTIADVRHRLPALARACLTALRIGHDGADQLIADCVRVLDTDSALLDNTWGDESRYLVDVARGRIRSGERAKRLDAAARRISRSSAVRDSARRSLVRLGEIWLER